MLAAHHHFPAATNSNPSSPTFPHSQSLSLNGAGIALALRPGTSVGHRPGDSTVPLTPSIQDDNEAQRNGRSYVDFVKSWDDDQVARWLGEVNVSQYEEVFRKNDIRGNVLLDVDQSALKEMGVRSVGDRVKITVAIKALRQRCVASAWNDRAQARAAASAAAAQTSPRIGGAAPNGMSSGSISRRPGSGRGGGRIPPPLHLAQSNVPGGELPQAYQPSATPGGPQRSTSSTQLNSLTHLGSTVNGTTSPRLGSPRSGFPPALPPPSSRPPPPPHRPSTSPPNHTISLPRVGAPGISTTAASPTNSYTGGPLSSTSTTANVGWPSSGDYGLPRGPAPGNLAGGAYHLRTSSTSPSSIDRARGAPPQGVAPPRPSTSAASQQATQHRKTPSSTNAPRPSTAQASMSYGHNAPLSSHPYATASSPTQDGFSVTTYGRASPSGQTPSQLASSLSGSTPLKLLPSPSIGQPILSPVSEGASTPSTGYSVGRGGFARPTTPGGLVSASGPVPTSASSSSSLDAVMRKAVKFIGDDGVSKMIAVADCKDGAEVLERVLRKFGKAGLDEDGEKWGVWSVSEVGGLSHLLGESELYSICRDGSSPERQRGLAVRRARQPSTLESSPASKGKRGRKLQWVFGESNAPESTRPGGVASGTSPTSPNYLGVEIPSTSIEPASPSSSSSAGSDFGFEVLRDIGSSSPNGGDRGKMNRASTVSVMSGLGGGTDYLQADPSAHQRSPSTSSSSGALLNSGRKLRNFFGQRPPSELITTHFTEYFPKAEKNKLLSKQVRQSIRRSMIRRDSQSSTNAVVGSGGGGTSWEKAPDRYSLTPSAMSRFSGSSGGSSSHLPLPSNSDDSASTRGPRLSSGSGLSSAPPSILEPMDEDGEGSGTLVADLDDDKADSRSIASSMAPSTTGRRMSRLSGSSRLSGWDRRSKDSDSASILTVDEVTAELETRRASYASYAGSSEDEDGGGTTTATATGVLRPPSIALSIDEDDEDDYSDEDDEDEDESSDEEDVTEELATTNSKPALKWIKGALIGAGSFGSVYLGMNPMSGLLMAVKQVELPTGSSHNEERKKSMLDALEREIELLKVLQHENIVQYLDSSSDGQHLNIFLEYVPGGSVAALLSNYGAFEEALVSKFVRQILTGLDYLHEREIIHRDIKGANILVDNKGGIKISDFGISKKVEDNLLTGAHRPSLQGSVYWMAPEVVKQTAYTSKADIWSLGCLVVEMLTGAHPWANLTQMQAIFRIGSSVRPTVPDDVSNEADDFLEQTFMIDHLDRPSARELLLHSFIRDPEAFAASQQTPTRATFSQNNSPVKTEA